MEISVQDLEVKQYCECFSGMFAIIEQCIKESVRIKQKLQVDNMNTIQAFHYVWLKLEDKLLQCKVDRDFFHSHWNIELTQMYVSTNRRNLYRGRVQSPRKDIGNELINCIIEWVPPLSGL